MTRSETTITVTLPDMFVSFLSQNPNINKYYEKIRVESDAWLTGLCGFNEKQSKRITRSDFSYFISIAASEAGPAELRTVCDWGSWVFPFDDRFDDGDLKDDPEQAQQEVDSLLAPLRAPDTYDQTLTCSPLVRAHNSVWFRFRENLLTVPKEILGKSVSPRYRKESWLILPGVQKRFTEAMEDYCAGVLQQVRVYSKSIAPDLEGYLVTRRNSIGAAPVYALLEYAYNLDIPSEAYSHESLQDIRRIGAELIVLQNDMLSYPKEQLENVTNNIISLYRASGLSAQSAFDKVGELLKDRYHDWYLAQARLPQWGEEVDAQVQRYIRGVQDVVLANLHWSFRSERYLGTKNSEVRRTRKIVVLPVEPPAATAAVSLGMEQHVRQDRAEGMIQA